MGNNSEIFADSFQGLLERHEQKKLDLSALYNAVVDRGLLPRVRVQQYQCGTCRKPVAEVIKIQGLILCATRDYKFSQGYNEQHSSADGRANNSLNGSNHWPGHVLDLSSQPDQFLVQVSCRHITTYLKPSEILNQVVSTEPGRPNKPIPLRHTVQ